MESLLWAYEVSDIGTGGVWTLWDGCMLGWALFASGLAALFAWGVICEEKRANANYKKMEEYLGKLNERTKERNEGREESARLEGQRDRLHEKFSALKNEHIKQKAVARELAEKLVVALGGTLGEASL